MAELRRRKVKTRLEHEEDIIPTRILCYGQLSDGESLDRGIRGDGGSTGPRPAIAPQGGTEGDTFYYRQRFAELEAVQFDHCNPYYKDRVWGLFGEQDTLAHFSPLFLEHYSQAFHFPGGHTPTEQEVKTWYAPLAQKYRIQSVPTLMLFINGEVLWRTSGVVDKAELLATLDPFLK